MALLLATGLVAEPASTSIAPALLDVGTEQVFIHPGQQALWLSDSSCTFNPIIKNNRTWQTSQAAVPNFGYSHDCNWLWLRVTNTSLQMQDKLLHLEKFHINHVQVILRSSNGSITYFEPTGADYPFSSRTIPHRHYLFPVKVNPTDTLDVFISIRNNGGTISAPINIYSTETLYAKDTISVLGMGFMSGLMGLIAVFNFLVYLSIRDRMYLFYSIYTLSILLILVNNQGYLFQYIWPSTPWWANFSRAVMAMVILYSFIRLGQHFLNLNKHYPRLNEFLNVVGWLPLLISVVVVFLEDFEWARRGFIFSMQVFSLVIPLLLVVSYQLYYRHRKAQVLVYIIAFTPAIVYLIALNLLIATGLFPVNDFYFYFLYACIIFEVLVLSTYLVINLKRIANEKNELLLQLNSEQSRQFSVALEASEGERKRIARDLHDGLGQLLSTARLYISGFDEVIKKQDTEHTELYQNSLRIIDDATQEVRNISHNLMPSSLIQLGLAAAVQGLARQLNGAGELKVWLEITEPIPRLPDTVEISLYRIVQEIVNNILKHARAKNIWLKLIYTESSLTLYVKDDGIGMNTKHLNQGAGIGWSNIFSRVTMLKGEYQIYSDKGKGTIIEVTVKPGEHG